MSEVVAYHPRFREAFGRLNRDWIEAYFTLEPADLETFQDPESRIIAPGGQIFFVLDGGDALGTCAVLRHSADLHEIAKMAVAPAARGRGYGDLLMDASITFSRAASQSDSV
jgi:GNAT superfamily N-acetyltransferase